MVTNITRQRKEISKTYFPNPFHNWLHGRWVWDQVAHLEWSCDKVTPGRMAGYFHDSDHRWFVQTDDEERSAEIADVMLEKWWFGRRFINQTKSNVMGTIFANRWALILPDQIHIADADLSKMWWEYSEFVKNSIRYLLETHQKWNISDFEIIDYFKVNQPKFFKHLTDISGRPETPFLSEEARILYPNFSRNKDFMAQEVEKYPDALISEVRTLEKIPSIIKFRQAV